MKPLVVSLALVLAMILAPTAFAAEQTPVSPELPSTSEAPLLLFDFDVEPSECVDPPFDLCPNQATPADCQACCDTVRADCNLTCGQPDLLNPCWSDCFEGWGGCMNCCN